MPGKQLLKIFIHHHETQIECYLMTKQNGSQKLHTSCVSLQNAKWDIKTSCRFLKTLKFAFLRINCLKIPREINVVQLEKRFH